MNDNLKSLTIKRKTGDERFYKGNLQTEFNLLGFWQWSCSDLVSNALRGMLAEYIVACDLGLDAGTRKEWDAYDLRTPDGIKIEVKSAAYLQSWKQNQLSKIYFDIRPTYGWDATTNTFSTERKRQADIYIFSILKHTLKSTLDPLNLDQWDFYVLPGTVLDQKMPDQKTITLAMLLRFNPVKAEFGKIKEAIYSLLQLR
jgi:hypothetical protein